MKQGTLESRAITKNGVKRLCFSGFCILLEAAFIIVMITRLNEYAEIINLITRLFAGILVLFLYSSDKTSSMKMPWIILILVFPIMGVSLYFLIGFSSFINPQNPIFEFFSTRKLHCSAYIILLYLHSNKSVTTVTLSYQFL